MNHHPALMFELIAHHQQRLQDFYAEVFGWTYETGTGGFAYVKFPAGRHVLLGGIGQANPKVPGFEAGHNFYLVVDDLAATLARVEAHGGTCLMPPSTVDGYHFAMFKDPEHNPIGLIKPFAPPADTGQV